MAGSISAIRPPDSEPLARSGAWTATRFFALLGQLGRLRVISVCGPSVFESLCLVRDFQLADGHVNAITDDYHWHLAISRFRHLHSHDAVHGRSGRRVLFFELREEAEAAPFLRVYLHRGPDEEFDASREARFAAAHADLANGCPVVAEIGR